MLPLNSEITTSPKMNRVSTNRPSSKQMLILLTSLSFALNLLNSGIQYIDQVIVNVIVITRDTFMLIVYIYPNL